MDDWVEDRTAKPQGQAVDDANQRLSAGKLGAQALHAGQGVANGG